jgi:tetraacyldisaccharide 4'-kinase
MKPFAILLSLIYRFVVFIRNKFYDNGYVKQKQHDCVVISVGNLSVGGTGKTPFVEMISDYLLENEKYIVILLKGYMREHDDIKVIELGFDNTKHSLNTENVGDEAFLMLENIQNKKGRCLIIVGEDKSKTATFAARKFKPEIMIIDDGFQHRKIYRDLDILIIDGNEGRHLIPAGRLREPMRNRIRADLLIVNEKFGDKKILGYNWTSGSAIAHYELKSFQNHKKDTTDVTGKKAVVFCGIGDPGSFKELLISSKVEILDYIEFRDHHNYEIDDIKKILGSFEKSGGDLLITTQKDFVRIRNSETVLESTQDNIFKNLLYSYPLYYTVVKMQIVKNGGELYSHLDKAVQLV